MVFNLLALSFLFSLPFVHSFQVAVSQNVPVNAPTQAEWKRTSGDQGSFSLLLRAIAQDHGGTLIQTVQSTSESQGTTSFTVPNTGDYLIEIISDLQPLANDQQPKSILASSNTFHVVEGSGSGSGSSNPPPDNTNTGQPPPATNTQTSSTSSTSSTSATANNGSGDNTGSPADGITSSKSSTATGAETTNSASKSPVGNISVPSTTSSNNGFTGSTPTPPASPSSSPSSSLSSSSSSLSSSSSSISDPTSTPTLGAATKSSSKDAIIVGVVVGALLAIILLSVFIFWYNRRRRRERTKAFQRDLMVRKSQYMTPFEFVPPPRVQPLSPEKYAFAAAAASSTSITEKSDKSIYSQHTLGTTTGDMTTHQSVPSIQSIVSSSPSVFYTAVPKPAAAQLAPGFTFPPVKAPEVQLTDRQLAIQNKMQQLRRRLVILQSRNTRGSWNSDEAVSEESLQERDEINQIREELERLSEIMNSGWALRQTNDVPAGLA